MYSTLEVNHWWSDQDKQVVPDDGKQLSINRGIVPLATESFAPEPIATESFAPEPVATEPVAEQNILAGNSDRPYLSWKEMVLISAFVSMIILTVVIGGVVGSEKRPSTQFLVPYSPQIRDIAALSFTFNSTNMTRVYFQDDEGQIVEAAHSHSANNTGWNLTNLGFGARNWSALAAAVSRPDFPLVSHVSYFFLNAN